MASRRSSLVDADATCRVSSVLNRDVKQFGKKFLFDGDEETCWNSDQGSPQFVQIDFGRQVSPKQLLMTFQGGFAGKDCLLLGGGGAASLEKICAFYPDDVNTEQTFGVALPDGTAPLVQVIRLVFESSTDFYGRVTV